MSAGPYLVVTSTADGSPVTGIWAGRWHAVNDVHPERAGDPQRWGTALCGDLVTITKYGSFDPDRWTDRACPSCCWTLAIRTRTVEAQYARLGSPLAARIARAVVAAEDGPGAMYELDHPATVQVLAAVSAHAGTTTVPGGCAEGEHDHPDGDCPEGPAACVACSLTADGWAGEWEGRFLPQAVIAAPCEVLRALARYYGVAVSESGAAERVHTRHTTNEENQP